MKHLAILRQPFLNLILSGEKTTETRWSKNKIAPYQKINAGDTVLLKESGKSIIAAAVVEKVKFYELNPKIFDEIENKYGKQICMEKFTNKEQIAQRNFCTLIWFKDIQRIEPRPYKRKGMSGWVLLE